MSAGLNECDGSRFVASFPQVDFPFKFYNFMREASESHPHVVTWSECGYYYKIDRRSPELPALLSMHFKHAKYESLRRQMNSYGFFINKSTDWWNLKSGFFCRDNPQLKKILPRPRNIAKEKMLVSPTTSINESIAIPASCKDNPPDKSTVGNLLGRETSDELLVEPAENPTSRPLLTKNVPKTNTKESRRSGKTTKRVLDSVNEKYSAAAKKRRNRAPHGAFPELLHKFICECSVSHPDVVCWNANRTAFNVQIHHPTLPKLLPRYFQHENYQSLRRQLNFYGFRRDVEGYYRNASFYYVHFNVVSSKSLKNLSSKKPALSDSNADETVEESSDDDSDDLSPLFDFDLSTYATAKTDELSVERPDDCKVEDHCLVNDRELESYAVTKEIPPPKFHVLEKVYVSDADGVMYLATIRRYLYGRQYQKQVDMALIMSIDEATNIPQSEDSETFWHYFVHFDTWNVNFDRWVAEHDIYSISDDVIAIAERISKEHRMLQLEMRKNVKGKKLFQTIEGTSFLREWKKRLKRLLTEMNFTGKIYQNMSGDDLDQTPQSSCIQLDQPAQKPIKDLWTQAALSTERKFRQQGLTTSRTQSNSIVLPFVLKKILVQQWEYVNQCRMMPCIPAPITIRQALNRYLESKNIELQTSAINTPAPLDHIDVVSQAVTKEANVPGAEDRDQKWRDVADGIAMLFDESLESRLLYREELPQLRSIGNIPEYCRKPYSELYGCEHLLRLFVRLPEMLSENLPEEEVRPIVAKVNDFVRFLHKNQGTLLIQTHRKLNESELKEREKINGLVN